MFSSFLANAKSRALFEQKSVQEKLTETGRDRERPWREAKGRHFVEEGARSLRLLTSPRANVPTEE